MDANNLKDILDKHSKWLRKEKGGEKADLSGANLTRANLTRANLTGANLSEADLTWADLSGANLTGANLSEANLFEAYLSEADLTRANLTGANLTGAYLSGANLTWANLTGANLSWANLSWANLSRADLTGANLTRANLTWADLFGANLSGADLKDVKNMPCFQIVPEVGSFMAFKAVRADNGAGSVLRVRIDAETARTNSIGSRKCRAENVFVVALESGAKSEIYKSPTVAQTDALQYRIGEYTCSESYNDDPRLEYTDGIHFFMTLEEAKEWVS